MVTEWIRSSIPTLASNFTHSFGVGKLKTRGNHVVSCYDSGRIHNRIQNGGDTPYAHAVDSQFDSDPSLHFPSIEVISLIQCMTPKAVAEEIEPGFDSNVQGCTGAA